MTAIVIVVRTANPLTSEFLKVKRIIQLKSFSKIDHSLRVVIVKLKFCTNRQKN